MPTADGSQRSLPLIVAGLRADAAFAGEVMQFHAQLLSRVVRSLGCLKQLVGLRKPGLFHASLHAVEVTDVRNQGISHAFGLSGRQLPAVHARARMYTFVPLQRGMSTAMSEETQIHRTSHVPNVREALT